MFRIRRFRYLAPIALLALFGSDARADIMLGPVVNPSNGHEYYLLTESSWSAAEAEAMSLGGHLATINDASENQWVLSTFAPTFGQSPFQLWIGLSDQASEGHFDWASGEEATYVNWAPSEPNNQFGDEDYVHIVGSGFNGIPVGTWNDESDIPSAGFGTYHGVVEVMSAVPEPSGVVLACIGGLSLLVYGPWRRRATRRNLDGLPGAEERSFSLTS